MGPDAVQPYRGIYFWEYGPERAFDWAREVARRRPDRIHNPAVLGAIIQLGNCFDLLDLRHTEALTSAYSRFVQLMQSTGLPIPRNGSDPMGSVSRVRRLDCAVLNWWLDDWASRQGQHFDSVRGVFEEGEAVFPGSGIQRKSHIQVAVRNPSSILGLFSACIESRNDS